MGEGVSPRTLYAVVRLLRLWYLFGVWRTHHGSMVVTVLRHEPEMEGRLRCQLRWQTHSEMGAGGKKKRVGASVQLFGRGCGRSTLGGAAEYWKSE